jgi:divalent metal cation (Fe/Co/Zn/Cd) transporter
MAEHLLQLKPDTQLTATPPQTGLRLQRQARLLAFGGIVWHFIEFAIALGAGLAASSIALVGFGVDSLIESFAGLVVVWRLTGRRLTAHNAERRAQQLIAASFLVLALYVSIEASRTLAGGDHPETSWVGIALAAFTAVTMPALAAAKRRVGQRLQSAATVKEGAQNMLCAYLSVGLLIGLLANALAGWWWADPAVALLIGAVAVREARAGWRGEGCCDSC